MTLQFLLSREKIGHHKCWKLEAQRVRGTGESERARMPNDRERARMPCDRERERERARMPVSDRDEIRE